MTTTARKKIKAYRVSQERSSAVFAEKVAKLSANQKTHALIKAGVLTARGRLAAHYQAA